MIAWLVGPCVVMFGLFTVLSMVWALWLANEQEAKTPMGQWLYRYGWWALRICGGMTGLILADTAARVLAARIAAGAW